MKYNHIINATRATVEKEYESQLASLTPENKILFRNIVENMASEYMSMSMSDSIEDKEMHARALASYKSAMSALEAIAKIKAYDSIINIIGCVAADILIAVGKGFLKQYINE